MKGRAGVRFRWARSAQVVDSEWDARQVASLEGRRFRQELIESFLHFQQVSRFLHHAIEAGEVLGRRSAVHDDGGGRRPELDNVGHFHPSHSQTDSGHSETPNYQPVHRPEPARRASLFMKEAAAPDTVRIIRAHGHHQRPALQLLPDGGFRDNPKVYRRAGKSSFVGQQEWARWRWWMRLEWWL